MLTLVSDFGQFCLLFAFCLACYAAVGSFLGGAIGHRRLVETAENSVIAMSTLVTLTVFSLWYQLISNNFNLQFVAQNSSRAMPWYYKFGALWGGQEGSLVFWC
jgi:cytochrome c-type biogenesis protein CcmF